MPYRMCPLCGEQVHVNTGNAIAYERANPELREIGVAIRRCRSCVAVLDACGRGSRVRVRRQIVDRRQDHCGRTGTVERRAGNEDGTLFLVRFDGDELVLFLPAELERIGE